MKLRLLVALPAFFCLTLLAQDNSEAVRGPDTGTQIRVPGIQVLPVAGLPFSGRDHIVWTRNLEDGGVVVTELYATVLRDSEGRIYREHRSFVPLYSNRKSIKRDIVLLDPVAHTRTFCVTVTRQCEITGYHVSPTFVPPTIGLKGDGTRYLSRESLGNSVIDDLTVVGTRETLSINSGAVGNTQTLVNSKEFWYSPDLQINLSVTRKDPRTGTQEIQLQNLSRSDPDPAMFRVPKGYVVRDLRQLKQKD